MNKDFTEDKKYHIFNRNIPVTFDLQEKFIYLNIPKNAQTSLIRGILKDRVVTKKNNYEKWQKINQNRSLKNEIVFSILREPLDRLVSTYQYFIEKNVVPKQEINCFIEEYIGTKKRKHKNTRFKQHDVYDHHLNPQYDSILYKNLIIPDKIVLMDDLFENNMNVLLKEIGCKDSMVRLNKSFGSKDVKKEIINMITKENQAKVLMFYQKDFELWHKLKDRS